MKHFMTALVLLGSAFNVFALDSYDPLSNELTIPRVQVGSNFYKDVKIKVGHILSVDLVKATASFDVYDATQNQLLIPAVSVGTTIYKNVVITVGDIVEVGGMIDVVAIGNSSVISTTILTIN